MAMTSASMKRDLLKAGKFAGLAAYLTKVTGVNNGGPVAISGDWIGLPSIKPYKYKRKFDSYEIEEQTGVKPIRKTFLGLDVKTTFNQRDADTYELDTTYVGAECVLLLAGHQFKRLTSPKYQWLAVFGEVLNHEDEIDVANGEVPFIFSGLLNALPIVLGAAVGAVAFPDLSTLTSPTLIPSADITILADGGYDLVDL